MATTTTARYDGLADWYDAYNQPAVANNQAELRRLLGPGGGLCLDLGCGTGQYVEAIQATGRTVAGLDLSADQLRVASGRSDRLAQGDAAALPFADETFATVVALWISTDVDDFGAVLSEAVRVLKPGGMLVFYGVHPCFNGPHTQYPDDGTVIVHPTYRTSGSHTAAPWWRPGGIRSRLGMRHVPLAGLLNAFIDAGLRIDRVEEPRDHPTPVILAVRAYRAGA